MTKSRIEEFREMELLKLAEYIADLTPRLESKCYEQFLQWVSKNSNPSIYTLVKVMAEKLSTEDFWEAAIVHIPFDVKEVMFEFITTYQDEVFEGNEVDRKIDEEKMEL